MMWPAFLFPKWWAASLFLYWPLKRFLFCFRIHPRDKQDVAYRLTLGARAVAYNEKDVPFLGPFPHQILSTRLYLNITYDQTVYVTQSKDIFEVRLAAVASVSYVPYLSASFVNNAKMFGLIISWTSSFLSFNQDLLLGEPGSMRASVSLGSSWHHAVGSDHCPVIYQFVSSCWWSSSPQICMERLALWL